VPDREADAHWQQLRHQSAPFFAGDEPLWRFSLPATTPALDLPGPQLIEWGGSQRWWRGPADAARREAMQGLALSLGGHATLFRGGDRLGAVFQSPSPAVLALQQRVARALDPRRVFATGRLFAEG
jgi:glycolate oxidase FAD binding subunit